MNPLEKQMEVIQQQIKELEDDILNEISKIAQSMTQVKNDIQVLTDIVQRQLKNEHGFRLSQFLTRLENQISIKLKNEQYPQCQSIFLQLQKAIKQNISIDEIEKLTNQLKDKTNNCLKLVTKTKNKKPEFYLSNERQIQNDFNSKLDNLIKCFQNTYSIIYSLINLIEALKNKKQQQNDLRKKTHVKVFEVINRLIEKTPSIIFKPFKQQSFLHRAFLQNFIEYQRQISQLQMKQQLNKLEKKIGKMFENKANSQKEVLMAKNVKDKQLQLQRLRSDMKQQSIRNQQQVSRLSFQLSSKDQTIKQLLTSIKQLQTCIKQLQTSNQTQSQQANSIMSQQQTTIQSQHEQLNQRSQQLQSQSQELVALSQQLALNKKLLQETISRNSQQTTKIIQENEVMKKKLEEKDQEIQRLNEEVGFLGLATKTQQQVNPSNELLKNILKELQHMKNDQISTITKKNYELQTQKLLLQAKLKETLQVIPKDSEHNKQNKGDANIKKLKQDIVRHLDKLSEMEDSTEKFDNVVSQLNDQIIQLKGKIDLQEKIITQLQHSLKQCQAESVKTKKSHQLELKRSTLQHQAEIQKAASLSNLLQQRQRQCETLRHELEMKSKEVINLKIQNQRLQSQLDEAV